MLGMIIGKSKDEALKLGNLFLKMIKGEATDEEIDELDEASALKDISHMPARVKCAVLGWHTLDEALKKAMDSIIKSLSAYFNGSPNMAYRILEHTFADKQ